jgi:hypothetical protein
MEIRILVGKCRRDSRAVTRPTEDGNTNTCGNNKQWKECGKKQGSKIIKKK